MSTMLLERIRYDASQKMRYYKKADSTEKEQYTPSQKEKVPGVIRFDE